MKKIFTFLVAFLTTVSGAVWGQQSHNMSKGDLDINVTGETTYTVTGKTDKHSISVSGGGTAYITLNGVDIQLNAKERGAFKITGNTTVYLTIAGGAKGEKEYTNLLRSDRYYAGIYVEEGSTLVITKESGDNHLKAESVSYEDDGDSGLGVFAAGIGGGSGDTPSVGSPDDQQSPNFGTIRIEGGNIETYCYTDGLAAKAYGAGLGGGQNSTKGDIIIIGGTVQASCMDVDAVIDNNQEALGAGIGGGEGGTCTSVTILGGNVTASVDAEGDYGYTIGTGQNNKNQSPTIILGSWDENTTPAITEKINDEVISGTPEYVGDYENYLDVRRGTPTIQQGEVTMPENTQMVLKEDPTADDFTLNAYKVSYKNAEGISSPSNASSLPVTMAYGASTSYTVANTTADATASNGQYQIVNGYWLDSSNAWAKATDTKTTTAGDANGLVSFATYSDAWVLKTYALRYQNTSGLDNAFPIYYPQVKDLFTVSQPEQPENTFAAAGLAQQSESPWMMGKADPLNITLTGEQNVPITFTPKNVAGATAQEGTIKVTITEKATNIENLEISVSGSLTYNGTDQSSTWLKDGSSVSLSIKEGTDELGTNPFKFTFSSDYDASSAGSATWSTELKNAGEYYIKVEPKETGEGASYTGYKVVGPITMNKADAKVTAADVEWTIGEGTGPDFSKALSVTGAGEDKLTASYTSTDPTSWTEPGIYNVTYTDITLSDTKNYNEVEDVTGKLTVNAKGTEGKPIDPNPGDGEEDEDPIIKPGDDEGNTDGWTWDAAANQWKRVYDGDAHPFTKITVTYTDETAEGENKTKTETLTVGAGADADVTVTYSTDEEGTTTATEVKNAATYYAHITINKEGVISGEVEPVELVIEERPVTVGFDLPASIDASTETLDASQYADWQKEGVVPNEGLVNEEKPICEGTLFLVESEDYPGYFNVYLDKKTFKVEDNPSSSFLVSNYIISVETKDGKIELEENGEGGETLPDDPNNPDDPIIDGPDEDDPTGGIEIDDSGSTGGSGISTKRYQLFLANKDYTFLDVKTDYADEGLELFSRHDKKYTKAGGSFTVWYEKDGVANAGGYRIFWSNKANGDYKEVKFDTVSEYFQIRNVQSNVYVKIYAADGFPVGNEEISAADYRAYAQPNKIVVITPQPTDVQIISMAGAVVATDKVTGQREFANLTEGVYIVRMGETVVKLQVRK